MASRCWLVSFKYPEQKHIWHWDSLNPTLSYKHFTESKQILSLFLPFFFFRFLMQQTQQENDETLFKILWRRMLLRWNYFYTFISQWGLLKCIVQIGVITWSHGKVFTFITFILLNSAIAMGGNSIIELTFISQDPVESPSLINPCGFLFSIRAIINQRLHELNLYITQRVSMHNPNFEKVKLN